MALPVEIADFFFQIQYLWFSFPLMVRQIFYLFIIVSALIYAMKHIQ